MTSQATLDVKVVYSASPRPGRSAPRHSDRPRPAPSSTLAASLGLVLAISTAILTFFSWWPIDRFIYLTIMWNTPIDAGSLTPLMNMARKPPAEAIVADQRLPAGEDFHADGRIPLNESGPPTDQTQGPPPPRFTGETARILIGACAYGWLTLSTISCCVAAVAAGSVGRRLGGPGLPRKGMILAVGGLLGLAYFAFDTYTRHQTHYPPSYVRWGVCGLVTWCLFLGLALARHHRGWSYAAATSFIVAAAGTVTALILGNLSGAVAAPRATPTYLAVAFGLHSLPAWIVLLLVRGLPPITPSRPVGFVGTGG